MYILINAAVALMHQAMICKGPIAVKKQMGLDVGLVLVGGGTMATILSESQCEIHLRCTVILLIVFRASTLMVVGLMHYKYPHRAKEVLLLGARILLLESYLTIFIYRFRRRTRRQM